ncbi:hypothetical protein BGZ76_004597, partial [Entomortierella beljakovae]
MALRIIILDVFGKFDSGDRWGRDPLPTPGGSQEKYLPDNFSEKDGLPSLTAEFKKQGSEGGILAVSQCEAIYSYQSAGSYHIAERYPFYKIK